jgi:hypothetical protein
MGQGIDLSIHNIPKLSSPKNFVQHFDSISLGFGTNVDAIRSFHYPNKIMKNFSWLLLSSLVVGWSIPVHSATISVDLELAFLIDGSTSIDQLDFNRQIQAYQNIFRDNFFNHYVAALPNRSLAVAAFQFGGTNDSNGFQVLSEWRLITDQAAANLFADQFSGKPQIGGRSPIGFAIQSAANGNAQPPLSPPVSPDTPPSIPGIFNNAYSGFSAIDITSDGLNAPFQSPPNVAVTPATGSDYARCFGDLNNCPDAPDVLPSGVNVINSLSRLSAPIFDDTNYGTNITGSTENFFVYGTIDNFEATLRTKLANEIGFVSVPVSVPEPNFTLGLLGLGLFGLGSRWFGRRK